MNAVEIERIVQEVLAVLRTGRAPEKQAPHLVVAATDCTLLDTKLVSLATLKNRLDGKRRLIIAKNTILTPSARDELRKRKVEIVVEARWLETRPRGAAAVRFVWDGDGKPPGGLAEALKSTFAAEIERTSGLAGIVNAVAHGKAVAFSREPAKTTCFANRTETVRALRGVEPKQIGADTQELDANLLVLDPRRATVFRIMEMVKAFVG